MDRATVIKQKWYLTLLFLLTAGIVSTALFMGNNHQEKTQAVRTTDRSDSDFFQLSNPTHFPLPDSLRPQVDFWKKIFSEYTSDQIVIHDRKHLSIVYGVIDLNKRLAYSRKARNKTIRLAEKRYRRILRKLKKLKPGNVASLSEEEQKIFTMIQEAPGNYSIDRAKRNIRVQYGLKDEFHRALVKSTPYLKDMERIFLAKGLPAELTRIPFIESSFNIEAHSFAGAAGIWQFTRPTGRIYMKIDTYIDERRDPLKSTEAAAKLLSSYYKKLKTWPLAITAYNHGSYAMQKAVKKINTRDIDIIINRYKAPTFGFSSRNYYAEFVAILEILKDYKQHVGEITIAAREKFDEFILEDYVKVKTLTKYSSLEKEDINRLNPELTRSVTKSRIYLPKHYPLKIPAGMKEKLESEYAMINPDKKVRHLKVTKLHRVQYGQNLSSIARIYKTSIHKIIKANSIENPNLLSKGQVLKIPTQI